MNADDSGGAGDSALARCIACATELFAREHWGRAPLLSRAGGSFGDLLSAAAVDELMSARGLRTPFLRMAKDGTVLPAARYTRGGGAGASIADQVADDKVLATLADGATLVLQALHRTWPPLVDFGRRLSAELGHPVQINAYITPPENQGFAPHYDVHDVFVLQIAGRKQWTIHEPAVTAPLDNQPWEQFRELVAARAAEASLIDTVLEPGDALYLPRGTIHAAKAQGETSIHLTIGVHPVTRYQLVRHLLELAQDDPQLRTSLPMGVDLSDPTVLAGELADTVAALHSRLDAIAAADVARYVGTDLMRRTRPEPIGPLAQLALAADLRGDSAVQLRAGLRVRARSRRGRGAARPARPHDHAAGRGGRRGQDRPGRRRVHAGRAAGPRPGRAAHGGAAPRARRRSRRGCAVRHPPHPRESLERCALRAQLRGDAMLGTAFPAARLLLVEQPGPWGERGLRDSRFGRAAADALEAWAARSGIRVQAVRRPGRTARDTVRRWALIDTRDRRESLRWGTFDTPDDLLRLPVDGSAGQPDADPLYLVCAHSKHDTCCALRGRPVAAALEAVRPGRVWECSHLGGDRFAANVLVLPAGLLYGRVLPFAAAEFVAAAEDGEVVGALLRGRVGLPAPAQAALAFAHEQLALRRRRDLQVLSTAPVHDGAAVVRLRGPHGEFDVSVQVERVAAGGLTCHNPQPNNYLAFRPVAILPVE